MTSKASRLAAFMATANTVALATAPSVETIATSFASLSNGAAFTGEISVANTISTGNAVVNGSLSVSGSANITGSVAVSNTIATGNAAVTGSLTVSGSATIAGNLVVNGSTVTVNTSQINVTDSLMYLATNNEISDTLDIGFAGHYNNGAGANGHTGLIRSAVDKKFHFFQNYQPEFYANNTINLTGLEHAPVVVGQVATGNATINVSVNATSVVVQTATTNAQLTANGLAVGVTVANSSTVFVGTSTVYASHNGAGYAVTNGTITTTANTTSVSVGANAYINSTTMFVGNSTVNTTITPSNFKVGGTVTANGANGSAGQVLTSSGTGVYWSTVSGGGGGSLPTTISVQNAVAIANASGSNSIAIGAGANASGVASIVIGPGATVSWANAIAIGSNSVGGFTNGVSVGVNAHSNGYGAIALGANTFANGSYGISVGADSYAYNGGAAFGYSAKGTGQLSIAMGPYAQASSPRSVAIGYAAQTSYDYHIVLGTAQHMTTVPGTMDLNGAIRLGGSDWGTQGQVLTSNGSSGAPYWSSSAGGGFSNGSSIQVANLQITGSLTANGNVGNAGMVLYSAGPSGIYWAPPPSGGSSNSGGSSTRGYALTYVNEVPGNPGSYMFDLGLSGVSGSQVASDISSLSSALNTVYNNAMNMGVNAYPDASIAAITNTTYYNFYGYYVASTGSTSITLETPYNVYTAPSSNFPTLPPNRLFLSNSLGFSTMGQAQSMSYGGGTCTLSRSMGFSGYADIMSQGVTAFTSISSVNGADMILAAYDMSSGQTGIVTFSGVTNFQSYGPDIQFNYVSASSLETGGPTSMIRLVARVA